MSPHLSSGHGFPKFWGHIWEILTANRTEFWANFWKQEKFWKKEKKNQIQIQIIKFYHLFDHLLASFQLIFDNSSKFTRTKKIIFFLAVLALFFSFCALFLLAVSIYLLPFLKIIFFSPFSRLVFSFVCPFSAFLSALKKKMLFFILILSNFNIKNSYVKALF